MAKQLKVVIVSAIARDGAFGGLERYVTQLRLAAQQHFGTAVSFIELPFDMQQLLNHRIDPILRDQLAGADIIHANDFMASSLCSRHAPDKPLITAFHLLHQFFTYQSAGRHHEKIVDVERQAIRNSTLLVANSRATEIDLVKAGADPARIEVVKNGVSSAFFDVDKPGRSSVLKLLFVGRLVEQKGADKLPSLAAALEQSGIDWHLEIAGTGPFQNAIQHEIGHQHPRCRFLGQVPLDQMPEVYSRNDVTVSMTRYEPFGLFALESIAAGTPVVGSIRDGMKEFCIANRNAISVDEQCAVAGIAERLTRISAGELGLPSASAVRSTVTQLTWRETINRLDAVYSRAA